ncbi:MAG: cbb3-type cytochrome c oxidase subunit II, partial [Bradymonadaceae bacterium]
MSKLHHDARWLFGTSAAVFIGLTLIIAVIPAIRGQSGQHPLPDDDPLTEKQRRGLKVYTDEGCAYCHTQQVRPIEMDKSLGRPSIGADYARLERMGLWRQTPAVLGSERTGPDLTNVGRRQPSKQWHLLHLYQPRAVAEHSVMPAFPWLFDVVDDPPDDATTVSVPEPYAPENGTVVAGERAEALVAYLKSLDQPPLPEGSETSSGTGDETADSGGGGGGASEGAGIYKQRCASCHQADGSGVPGTFPPLAGDPVVTANDPTRHVEIVVDGLQGKAIEGTSYAAAMPAFGDKLSDDEIAAVINHERTSWGNDAPTVTADEVADIRRAMGRAGTSA